MNINRLRLICGVGIVLCLIAGSSVLAHHRWQCEKAIRIVEKDFVWQLSSGNAFDYSIQKRTVDYLHGRHSIPAPFVTGAIMAFWGPGDLPLRLYWVEEDHNAAGMRVRAGDNGQVVEIPFEGQPYWKNQLTEVVWREVGFQVTLSDKWNAICGATPPILLTVDARAFSGKAFVAVYDDKGHQGNWQEITISDKCRQRIAEVLGKVADANEVPGRPQRD
jgi:hypothetical protein